MDTWSLSVLFDVNAAYYSYYWRCMWPTSSTVAWMEVKWFFFSVDLQADRDAVLLVH